MGLVMGYCFEFESCKTNHWFLSSIQLYIECRITVVLVGCVRRCRELVE